jgi:hypothetical protein
MRDRLRVEDEPRHGRLRAANRLAHTPLEVAGVGEEEPIVEPVDDDAGRHGRGAVKSAIPPLPGGRRRRYPSDGGAMRQVHVIVTWRSEHLVELEDEESLENLAELLQAQSNVKLVGYTAQPLHKAVDAAIDELLDQ